MRLKKLSLQGFKSFADRTDFVFDAPITGVVGPNGCGKSNVVDGVKWVLGEQSAKSLRGDAMMDVIFNGSGGRKPAGMAEVVLLFDNPRRPDGQRMLNVDTDEVAVGRRLYRDGTSEYQINNRPTRLKDIREMFLDTGVGVDAYSVIEQGRVAAMLDASSQERRLIFEEAAGISKFKARRREAERKLEKVQQNLLRVSDIVDEVRKRLRSVKVQAGRARTYQEHSAKLRELRLSHSLQEYHAHHAQLGKLDAARDDAQFRLNDVTQDLQRQQNELAGKRQELESLTRQRQQVEYDLVQAKAAMQSAQQRQQYAQQQLDQIAEQLETFKQDRSAAGCKLEQVAAALADETSTLDRLSAEMDQRRRQIEQRQQAFRDGQLQLNALLQQLEQHKTAILDLMRTLAGVNSRLGAIEIERKNISAQEARLGERRRIVLGEIDALDGRRAELQDKLDGALADIERQQSQLDTGRAEAAALGQRISRLGEQLGAAREHRSGLVSRQKLLSDLEARREGVSEGVKSVLRQRDERFGFVRGLVADVIRVDIEHAHVIEAALDGRDQLMLCDDSAAAVAASETLADLEGRVSLLCTDRLPQFVDGYDWNQHPQRLRLAVDLVRVEHEDRRIAEHLLGHTVVVDELVDAAQLARVGPAGYRYVTAAGEVVEADGTLRAGPLAAGMGLVSRRSELEAITQQLAEVDARIDSLTRQLADDSAHAQALAVTENAIRAAIYQSNTAKVELTSQLAQVADRRGALLREQPVLERELAQLMDQSGRLVGEEQALGQKRVQLETDQASRQEQVELLTQRHRDVADELRQLGEQLTNCRVELGQVQEKQLASRQQVQRYAAAKSELAEQIDRIDRSVQAVVQRRGGVQDELQTARQAETDLVTAVASLSRQLESIVQRVDAAGETVQSMGGKVESIRASLEQVEQELHQVQLQLSELRVRIEGLVQRTRDELEIDLPQRYAELSAPREDGTPGPGYQGGEVDWDAVAIQIRELKEKIHRLGNVNLDAINEQDELEQRDQFLSAQVTDLDKSRQQLLELIETINNESSIRFEQTFNAVREHFQGMFRKLFGGGKADIYLETELEQQAAPIVPDMGSGIATDGTTAAEPGLVLPPPKKASILDAGIEIIARPPGKQPATISQLSGGEKTMTCIALLMSIFKSKPSPFCILDEVDAALDEANNQRFNLIVQEFLDQSQFIIITHSKRTMQIADVLYGITMQEQGVSRHVAVKFDQVDAEGRVAETAAA